MSDYVITVKVPFTYDGEHGNITGVGLAYLLDVIAEHGMGGTVANEVEIKIKKKRSKLS
jgi:hypothetical protein